METLNDKFMREIAKIKEPEVFIGVARVLGVKLVEDEKDEEEKFVARDFTEIFSDVMKNFDGAPRKRKRELFKILREANQVKG